MKIPSMKDLDLRIRKYRRKFSVKNFIKIIKIKNCIRSWKLPVLWKIWVQKLNRGQIFKNIPENIFEQFKCITCDFLKNKDAKNADDYLMMAWLCAMYFILIWENHTCQSYIFLLNFTINQNHEILNYVISPRWHRLRQPLPWSMRHREGCGENFFRILTPTLSEWPLRGHRH